MKILITGGVGFIGVNAAEYFLKKNWDVTILDNFSRKGVEFNESYLQRTFGNRVEILRGDICTDQDLLHSLVEQCDVVLHLAAQVAVTTSVINPREDFEVNALGTFNVLEAVRGSKRKPIVLFASTNKVYGGLEDLSVMENEKRYVFSDGRAGVTERQPLDFHSPYGCSNGAADQYTRDYARMYGLQTVVFRQSCIYGPHQLGLEDQGWVAWFMIAGMMGRPVQIYGNGKQVRDLLYVDDLVRCYDRAIERIHSASGQIYNLGGGAENTLSLLEFMELLEEEHEMKMDYSFAETRPGDQPIYVSDNGKAKSDLGWSPTVDLKQGIGKLSLWLNENREALERIYKKVPEGAPKHDPVEAL
jgi:CDP-paratose 2-epimerase